MNPVIHNEQVKLFATFLNTLASASIVAGVFAPFSIALLSGGGAMVTLRSAVYAVFWLALGALLHARARRTLEGLV